MIIANPISAAYIICILSSKPITELILIAVITTFGQYKIKQQEITISNIKKRFVSINGNNNVQKRRVNFYCISGKFILL